MADFHPIMQLAIDTVDPVKARELARAGAAAGADWLEIGKPFIEFNGIRACAHLIEAVPNAYWLADLMIMAGSRRYIDAVRELGIRNVTATGLAPQETVREAITLARKAELDITVDLFNVTDPVSVAKKAQAWGATHVMVHLGVDQKRINGVGSSLRILESVVQEVQIPVSYAVYEAEEARGAIAAGASVIVQGEPLISESNPEARVREYLNQIF